MILIPALVFHGIIVASQALCRHTIDEQKENKVQGTRNKNLDSCPFWLTFLLLLIGLPYK